MSQSKVHHYRSRPMACNLESQVRERLQDLLSSDTIEHIVLYDWTNVPRAEHLQWCLEEELSEVVFWAKTIERDTAKESCEEEL